MYPSFFSSLDALSKKRAELAALSSSIPHNPHFANDRAPPPSQIVDHTIPERMALMERVMVQVLSRINSLEENQQKSKDSALEETLANVDRLIRDAVAEMTKLQVAYETLRAECDTLRANAAANSNASSSSHSYKPPASYPSNNSNNNTATRPKLSSTPNGVHSGPVSSPNGTTVSGINGTSSSGAGRVALKRQAPSLTNPQSSRSVTLKQQLPPHHEENGLSSNRVLPTWQVEYPPGFNPNRGRRFSVASESFNPSSTDFQHYERKVIRKSTESRQRIRTVVRDNILFRNLEEDQIESIIDEMFETTLKADEVIIKQGDDGDNFYVVESGELYVLYKDTVVATIGAGKGFGEIALMYNCPRTATVRAKTECTLWGLDRTSFRHNLMMASIRKRDLYESFLGRVPLLESLLPYERSTIADALEPQTFTDGQYIIRQGERGELFYIIEKGRVIITKSTAPGEEPIEVTRPGEGSYFGELALLSEKPRAATVQALGTVRVLCLSRQDFAALMGPCEDILKRNMEIYKALDIEAKLKEGRNSPAPAPRNRSVQQICTDFMDDERTYLQHLGTIVEYFLVPLRQSDGTLSGEDIASLFGNIEMLLTIHKQLEEEFPKGPERSQRLVWGRALLKFVPALRFYLNYASNFSASLQVLEKLKGSEILTTLSHQRPSSSTVPLDLATLLREPLDRVPRYISFLKELQTGLPPNDPELKDVSEAIAKMAPVNREIEQARANSK